MMIRCPQCEHTRTVNTAAIPPTAEMATCPKCGHRFRFRTLPPVFDPEQAPRSRPAPRPAEPPPARRAPPLPGDPPPEREIPLPPPAYPPLAGSPADYPPNPAGEEHAPPLPADTPVEERVERDLQLLRHEGDRPSRDLGRLDPDLPDFLEMPPPDMQEPLPEEGDKEGIPWENPAAHGWIRAFLRTLYAVMFNPPAFFARLRPSRSLAAEYLFFILLGYIAILSSVAWTQAALYFLPNLQTDLQPRISFPLLFLVAPVALGLMLLFAAGGIHVLLRIFSAEPADFSLVSKVVSYAISPFILSVVPFVGPVVGALWFLITLFSGCRHGLGLPWKPAAAVSLPPALLLISGVVWFFL